MPAAWWSHPALTVTALLGGMLAAIYVRSRADRDVTGRSAGGGLLSLLAIGCPVVTTGALDGGVVSTRRQAAPLDRVQWIGLQRQLSLAR